MEIEGNQIRELIFHWIKGDQKLNKSLRDIQIKILIERIVKQMSFEQMAKIYKSHPNEVRQIFQAILMRIEKSVSKPIADLLNQLNQSAQKDTNRNSQHFFDFNRIFKN